MVVVCVHSRLRFLSLAVFTKYLGISLRYATMSFPAFPNRSPSLHQLFAFVTKPRAHMRENFRNHRLIETSTSSRRSLYTYIPIDGRGRQACGIKLWSWFRTAYEARETSSMSCVGSLIWFVPVAIIWLRINLPAQYAYPQAPEQPVSNLWPPQSSTGDHPWV